MAEAGEDVHLVARGLAVELVQLAEDLHPRFGGVVEPGADAIEVELDVLVVVLARLPDDAGEELLRFRMVGQDPVRPVGVEQPP
jgi:hypothetical protein